MIYHVENNVFVDEKIKEVCSNECIFEFLIVMTDLLYSGSMNALRTVAPIGALASMMLVAAFITL